MANKRNAINSLEDLQKQKVILRDKVAEQEGVLKERYRSISEKAVPIFKIAGFLSGGKNLFGGKHTGTDEEDGGEEKNVNWIKPLFKILSAAFAGRFLLKRTKKNLSSAVMSYALEQGLKYITEKDVSSHIDKLKSWLSKDEKKQENTENDE